MLIPDDATPVALGRQALGLAARRARDAGCRTVLVPRFCCQTMVTPWELEGMAVHRVPVGPDLLMDSRSLSRRLDSCLAVGDSPIVLHCETFGLRAGAGLEAVLAEGERAGAQVVVDRTHSFLDRCTGRPATTAPGRVEVVSTRKLLPLGELSWITGGGRELVARSTVDERLTAARLRFLAAPSVEAFEEAEDLADEAWTPVPPHPQTLAQVQAYDAAGLARRILATRGAVLRGLDGPDAPEGVDVVNPGAVCPLVLRLDGADLLADELYRHGLVGPIHWDRPENLPGTDWPEDLLCLPAVMDADGVETVLEALHRLVQGPGATPRGYRHGRMGPAPAGREDRWRGER